MGVVLLLVVPWENKVNSYSNQLKLSWVCKLEWSLTKSKVQRSKGQAWIAKRWKVKTINHEEIKGGKAKRANIKVAKVKVWNGKKCKDQRLNVQIWKVQDQKYWAKIKSAKNQIAKEKNSITKITRDKFAKFKIQGVPERSFS